MILPRFLSWKNPLSEIGVNIQVGNDGQIIARADEPEYEVCFSYAAPEFAAKVAYIAKQERTMSAWNTW